jgi:hypothetical protein
MKIMMLKSAKGAARSDGAVSMEYTAGSEYTAEAWQEPMFEGFVARGLAHYIGGNVAVAETKAKPVRKARK